MRRLLLVVALTAAVAVAAGAGWYGWRRLTAPAPPDVPLAGAEPAVARAVEAARAGVRREPRSAEAWGRLGLVLRAHRYDPQADACFARAERLAPGDPRWPYQQALPLRLRDPDAALPSLRRAADLCDQSDPGNTAPRLLLAETLLEKGDLDGAEAHLRRALGREPDNPRTHYDLGLVAFARGDLEASVTELSHGTGSPFARQKASAQLAAVYRRLGDDAATEAFGRQARQLPPDRPWNDPYVGQYLDLEVGRQSRFLQAERLEAEGRVQEGARVLQEMAAEFPDERSHVALGITLAKAGRYEAAEQVLRAAVREAPGKMQAHYFLSAALFQEAERLDGQGEGAAAREKYRAAADSARRAAELKPDHAFAHVFLGRSLGRLGRRAEAVEALRQAVRCRPELAEAHLDLGEALAEQGQDVEALRELQQAADLAPREDARPAAALLRTWVWVLLRRLS